MTPAQLKAIKVGDRIRFLAPTRYSGLRHETYTVLHLPGQQFPHHFIVTNRSFHTFSVRPRDITNHFPREETNETEN